MPATLECMWSGVNFDERALYLPLFDAGPPSAFYTIDLETLTTRCAVMLPYLDIKKVAAKLNEGTAAFFQDLVAFSVKRLARSRREWSLES